MQLVEQHIIRKGDVRWAELDRVGWYSKNIYNAAMYLIRQHYFEAKKYLNYRTIEKRFKKSTLLPDQALPLNTVQQVLMQVDRNWRNYFAALKEYRKHPEKFLGEPRIPKYKDVQAGRNVVVYTRVSIRTPSLREGIVKLTGLELELHTKRDVSTINQVRIVPQKDYYAIEVVYTVDAKKVNVDKNKMMGIDLGVDNLATLTSNQPDFVPLLVNGRILKSINQWYNKRVTWLKSQLRKEQPTSKQIQHLAFKRNQRIQHHLHAASKYIIELMLAKNMGLLVIGKNEGWKQSVAIGKTNNQNFVQIPHTRFIQMLKYKAELHGIDVIETEESYTSKCSFLDLEPIGKHKVYAGKRIKRAVFVTSIGQKIHSDVNGSYNIIRKVFPNAFDASGIVASAVMPVRVSARTNLYFVPHSLGF
jgi:putative transposase